MDAVEFLAPLLVNNGQLRSHRGNKHREKTRRHRLAGILRVGVHSPGRLDPALSGAICDHVAAARVGWCRGHSVAAGRGCWGGAKRLFEFLMPVSSGLYLLPKFTELFVDLIQLCEQFGVLPLRKWRAFALDEKCAAWIEHTAFNLFETLEPLPVCDGK